MKIDLTKAQAELVRSIVVDWLDTMEQEDEEVREAIHESMVNAHAVLAKLEVES